MGSHAHHRVVVTITQIVRHAEYLLCEQIIDLVLAESNRHTVTRTCQR